MAIFAVAWDFAVTLFGMVFSAPFLGMSSSLGFSSSTLPFFYPYESMYYHALAIPFVAALSYVSLAVFDLRGRMALFVASAVTIGFVSASSGALLLVLEGGNPLAFGILWAGLSLTAMGGFGIVVALFPRSERRPVMNTGGRSLSQLVLWVSAISLLAAVSAGAYASTGSSQWGAASQFKGFVLVMAAHIHTVIAIADVAVVALMVRHFKADTYAGVPGTFVKWGLYGLLVGTPTTTIATFATVPMGVEAHNVIIVFACILLQASLFIMYAIVATEARKPGFAGVKGVLGNIMTYGMLFVIFWVNVVVTLPGIYVALNLSKFAGLPNETAFITGHEHVLITLTAMALIMLIALVFHVKGRLAIVGGLSLTAGYILSSSAAVLYIFKDWNPTSSIYLPYMAGGMLLMAVGVATVLLGLLLSDARVRPSP